MSVTCRYCVSSVSSFDWYHVRFLKNNRNRNIINRNILTIIHNSRDRRIDLNTVDKNDRKLEDVVGIAISDMRSKDKAEILDSGYMIRLLQWNHIMWPELRI